MITNLTPKDLIEFEEEIAEIYKEGKIRAPIHLRSNNEQILIDLFQNVRKQDWIFGYWALHTECLLKGVPREELKKEIIKGNSIALQFPEYRVMGSGIVGSLCGVAVGLAWSIKQQGINEYVYLCLGDMQSECGIFHEAVKYATNFNLPIEFWVLNNGISVLTDTKKTWGTKTHDRVWWYGTKYAQKIRYRSYVNGWPHSGIGSVIQF